MSIVTVFLAWSAVSKSGSCSVKGMTTPLNLATKPKLGFLYESLHYEPGLGIARYSKAGDTESLELTEMSEAEKQNCENYIKTVITSQVPFAAYDPNRGNAFVGKMFASLVEQKQLKGVFLQPEHPASRYDETAEAWIRIYAIIHTSGDYSLLPDGIPADMALMFTKEEWETAGPVLSDHQIWDFTSGSWHDRRDLESHRAEILYLTGNAFNAIRQKVYGRLVENYEQASWPIKYREAKAWIKDRSTPTPYFDDFSKRRRVEIVKETYMNDILDNDRRFTKLTAIVDAFMNNFFDQIKLATSTMELDTILGLVQDEQVLQAIWTEFNAA